MAVGPTGTVSGESTVLVVVAKNAKTKKKRAKQQEIVTVGLLLNEETANNAIMIATETILSSFKPLKSTEG